MKSKFHNSMKFQRAEQIFCWALLFLLVMSGCRLQTKNVEIQVQSPEPQVQEGVQSDPTQIGDFFERELDLVENQKKYKASIFRIQSDMAGTKGIGTYLGSYKGHQLLVTNKHIVDSDWDYCDQFVSAEDVQGKVLFTCKGFIFSLKDMDITFLTMEDVFGQDPDLNPLELSAEPSLESLVLRTIDRDQNAFVVDKGQDCFALDQDHKLIEDPYPTQDMEAILTWSQPVGCDAQPGDSGAPIFDSSQKIAGLLWGGKYKKTFVSSFVLKEESRRHDEVIWSDFNFMVPAPKILGELENQIQDLDPESVEHKVLSEFLNQTKMAQVEGLEPPTQ